MEIEEQPNRLSVGSCGSVEAWLPSGREKISLESNISDKYERSQDLFQKLLRGRGSDITPRMKMEEIDAPSVFYEQRIQSQAIESSESTQKKKGGCKCQRSRCLQMYCQCFAQRRMCGSECACQKCQNCEKFRERRESVIGDILRTNPDAFGNKFEVVGDIEEEEVSLAYKKGCKCKKTKCLKKYCECYFAGLKCSYLCTCEHCQNQPASSSD